MKKIIALLLICSLTLGMLTACGKEEEKQSGQNSNQTNNQTNNQNNQNNQTGGGGVLTETGGTITYTIDSSLVSGMSKVNTGSLYVTESMLDTGISRVGSLGRLAAALEKAAYGQTVTIAYIGGGIAAGKGASSYENSYAALTTQWWKDTFPEATINEVNIGIVNGDSYLAAHRVASEVISKNPDVVIIDTAAEDIDAIAFEAYESMIRVLLSSGSSPAVIPLVTTSKDYKDNAEEQAALAFKLDLPVISYAAVLESNITSGTWSWADVADVNETLYPSDSGHAFIAYLLTGYFGRVLSGVSSSQYKEFVLSDSTSTKARFTKASLVKPDQVPHSGEDNSLVPLPQNENAVYTQGMCTLTGQDASFTVTGKNIGMFYWKSIDGESGQFDLYVDGELVTTLDGDLSAVEGATENYMEYIEIGKYDASGEHEIKLVKNADSVKDDFYVIAFAVSE